jgi:hypothetical protein
MGVSEQQGTPPNDAALDLLVSCCCEQTDTPTADLAADVVAEVRRLRAALVRLRDAAALYHDNPPIDLSWKVRMKSMHEIAAKAVGNE